MELARRRLLHLAAGTAALPAIRSLRASSARPSPNGRRVGIRIVTFEACSGFTRVTVRRIAQAPGGYLLSRGSNPHGCPHKPLVSYRINRQLFGWILPPLVIRALRGALPKQTLLNCQMRHCPNGNRMTRRKSDLVLTDASKPVRSPAFL